jgi:putative hydrolase of the HAD superfamily
VDLIFDLYHTLLDGADDERDLVVSRMAVVVGVPPDVLVAAYHASWRERLVRWSVEETIEILTARLGVSPTGAQVARAAELRRALARRLLANVRPSTLEALDRLRAKGHRLALISNATAETAEAWPQTALAARFDAAVFSATAGLAKPDPAIYRLAAARLGASPETCVFIGDGADDELDGAAAAGMTPIRTVEHRDGIPAWPGRTIPDLNALLI